MVLWVMWPNASGESAYGQSKVRKRVAAAKHNIPWEPQIRHLNAKGRLGVNIINLIYLSIYF